MINKIIEEMGASSSVCTNKIYKHVDCGCIYCFDSYEIQLLYCCYDCLETLRNNKKPKNCFYNISAYF